MWWSVSIEKGVLMFTPVGFGGATVKICPPLVITEEAMRESLARLEESLQRSACASGAAGCGRSRPGIGQHEGVLDVLDASGGGDDHSAIRILPSPAVILQASMGKIARR